MEPIHINGRQFEIRHTAAVNARIMQYESEKAARAALFKEQGPILAATFTEEQWFRIFEVALKPLNGGERFTYEDWLEVDDEVGELLKKKCAPADVRLKLLSRILQYAEESQAVYGKIFATLSNTTKV